VRYAFTPRSMREIRDSRCGGADFIFERNQRLFGRGSWRSFTRVITEGCDKRLGSLPSPLFDQNSGDQQLAWSLL
jgi:hypothetical protein